MLAVTQRGARCGFTLVELLIVMVVVGILAGILFMTLGAAPDKAEVTKIISDIGNLKYASFMYYANYSMWPQPGDSAGWSASLDKFLDRPLVLNGMELDIKIVSGHYLIGLMSVSPAKPLAQPNVQRLFEAQARESGLLDEFGMPYTAGTAKIYMPMR